MVRPMNVLLLQLDGKIPNIALMRLAAHHNERGDRVELRVVVSSDGVERELGDDFDRVYASCVFEKTRPVAARLRDVYPDAVVGGSGWDLKSSLEALGVSLRQNYSVYPAERRSIGFTQRGCRFRCPFCVVHDKEGANRQERTVAQIWRGDPWPRELLLLDNDFFGQPNWRDRVDELRAGKFRVSFNQGINVRTLTDEEAAAMASVDYRDDSMKTRRIYTAWDNPKDEARVFRGLELLVKHGVKPAHLMVYVLVGFWPGETWQDRDRRRARLREFGAVPYPMPFVRTPELIGFQRWIIGAYDKQIPWAEWSAANFDPHKLTRRAPPQEQLFTQAPHGDG